MTFQPIVPLTGYSGWRFLERTQKNQLLAFSESQPVARATEHFRNKIDKVRTVDELMDDRQLLSVALGAFGLDEDIANTFYIKKILEDGTNDDDALANRLTDNRYADFSRAFGFGDSVLPRTGLVGFAEEIIDRYEARQFERAVGDQNNNLRLAMNVNAGISDILDRTSSEGAQWFSIMGNAPLREVFQTALGLPSNIASIDLDKQLELFQERSTLVFSTEQVSEFADRDLQEKLIRLFLVRSEAADIGIATGSTTALTLLRSALPSV